MRFCKKLISLDSRAFTRASLVSIDLVRCLFVITKCVLFRF